MTSITAVFKFQKSIGKSRYDLIKSVGSYAHFEKILKNQRGYNVGGLSINLGLVPEYFNNSRHRATQAITRGDNISKMFLLDIEHPNWFYGDAKGTSDALVIFKQNQYLTIFVFKGLRHTQTELCELFIQGYFDAQLDTLKEHTKVFELPPFERSL